MFSLLIIIFCMYIFEILNVFMLQVERSLSQWGRWVHRKGPHHRPLSRPNPAHHPGPAHRPSPVRVR